MTSSSTGRAAGESGPSTTTATSTGASASATTATTTAQSTTWEPDRYLRFAGQRVRPVRDLLAQIGAREPRFVADLGCGPGNATELFSDHWPRAHVLGVDSSAEMVESASRRSRPGRLDFTRADLREWTPSEAPDLLISNAAFNWIPGHLSLLPRLLGLVAPGGCFAFSVPGNGAAPSHTLLADLQRDERWSEHFTGANVRPRSHEPAEYLRVLTNAHADTEAEVDPDTAVDVWESTYYFVLDGEDGALDYAYSTILRPVLTELGGPDTEDARAFLAEYSAALRDAYPPAELGGRTVQVMPYRRIFAVAHVPVG